jgi:hypothetical protein
MNNAQVAPTGCAPPRRKVAVLAGFAFCKLCLAMPALLVGIGHRHDSCLLPLASMPFHYPAWMQICGWAELGQITVAFMCAALAHRDQDDAPLQLFTSFGCLFVAFELAWYVVGVFLWFAEISTSCAADSVLYSIGLFLYIFGSILVLTNLVVLHEIA